jgi:hypothetical protein
MGCTVNVAVWPSTTVWADGPPHEVMAACREVPSMIGKRRVIARNSRDLVFIMYLREKIHR